MSTKKNKNKPEKKKAPAAKAKKKKPGLIARAKAALKGGDAEAPPQTPEAAEKATASIEPSAAVESATTSLEPSTDLRTPESPPLEPTPDGTLPLYKDGCPDCKEKRLVTQRKAHGERICRCLVCSWRGAMRSK